jgi:hypothetical protein
VRDSDASEKRGDDMGLVHCQTGALSAASQSNLLWPDENI